MADEVKPDFRYTGSGMAEHQGNILSKVGNWINKHRRPLVAGGATMGVGAVILGGGTPTGPTPDQVATLNPYQERIHQMEKNGMPQSDEAMRLDKEFPADHIQTKDVIIASNAELLTAPTNEASAVDNNNIIINGDKFVNEKQVTLSNGLEINDKSGRYLIFMNVMVGGQETILYINEAAVNHPFGDSSVPATHDANGGYQSTDGTITALDINVLTTPRTSPLDATLQP